jgi:rhodanese-related sulfurtransferase
MQEINVKQLAEQIENGSAPTLIDVREPNEYALVHLPDAVLKPLGSIYQWAQELDKDQEYVLYCHTGSRSWQAAYMLERMGFKRVVNLSGGIDAWSIHVDASMPRY